MKDDKRTISIRFNGENKDSNPELHKEESAAAEEKEFEWILPERRDSKKVVDLRKLQKKSSSTYTKSKKKHMLPLGRKKKKHSSIQRPSITLHKSVVVSVASAVFLGVLFGFILLMVFSGDQQAAPPSVDEANVQNVSAPVAGTSDLSLNLHVVQSGVYSTEESAVEFKEKLKENGFPAAIIKSDKYYLMIGVSSTVEGQEALEGYFKSKGEDVYAKPWNISSENVVLTAEGAAHLKKGKTFIDQLVSMDLNGLTDNEFDSDKLASIDKELTEWSDKSPGIEGWKDNGGAELVTALSGALSEMKTYEKEETVSSLWVAQQHLLDALVSYQEIMESVR